MDTPAKIVAVKQPWRRISQGFVAWSVPACLLGVLGQYLFYPDTFSFNFDLATFTLIVPLALVFTAIQTTTEELLFRMQASHLTDAVFRPEDRPEARSQLKAIAREELVGKAVSKAIFTVQAATALSTINGR